MVFDDFRGDADADGVRRDVFEDDGVGADLAVVADGDGADDHRAAADVGAVLDDGLESTMVAAAGDAEGGVLADVDVIADGAGAEDHAAMMPDADTAADGDGVGEADAADPLDELVENFVEEREGETDDFGFDIHPPVAEAVNG